MPPKPRNRQQQQPDNDDDDDDGGGAVSFSDAQRDEINKLVNAAVGSQLGRKLGPALETAMSPILEKMQAIAGGKASTGDEGGTGERQGPKGGKVPEGETEREKELRLRVEELDRKSKQMDAERKTERDNARNAKRDATLREELTKNGVDPMRMKGALAVLRESTIVDEKSGDVIYKAQREGYVDDLDVAKGVKEWADSDEGKAYRTTKQPEQRRVVTGAVNVIGASGGSSGAGGKGGKGPDPAKVERKEAALDKLTGAVGELIGGGNINVGG